MSYKLNKTDGSLLLDLIDGVKNTSATDIALIGRNSTGFGESVNENFIAILENFASTSAPAAPLEGQLWFDTTTDTLRVYDGTDFKAAGGAYVQTSQPAMSEGDLWYNTTNKQMYSWDGDELQLLGPLYKGSQGLTGEIPDTILDTQGFERSVIKHYVGGNLAGVWSNLEFKISATNADDAIIGLSTDALGNRIVEKGFNILQNDYKIHGTATNAEGVGGVDVSKFVRTDITSTIDASLIVRGNDGIKFTSVHQQKIDGAGSNFQYQNLILNDDMSFRVSGSATGAGLVDAIKIKAATARVGIYNSTPDAMLHVGTSVLPGSVIIEGDLTVKGSNSFIETQTLRIQDKNLELGILEDSTVGTNADVDGAGIIIQSSQGSKDFLYQDSNESFFSNQNMDLANGKEYKINGNTVLTPTALGAAITSAPGITSLGVMTSLQTNFTTISGSTIATSNGQHLNLSAAGDIVVNNSIIRGVTDSLLPNSVTTKAYVDAEIMDSDVAVVMDITGMSNTDIRGYLDMIYPDNTLGRKARVLGYQYSYSGTTDVENSKSVVNVSVDKAGSLESQSVVQTVTFSDAVTTVAVTSNKILKTFLWDGTTWLFQS